MQPLRIIRGKDVDVVAELGEVPGQLERPLHAGAPGGRPVQRDDEDAHTRLFCRAYARRSRDGDFHRAAG